jgi:hypothetical protein
VLILGQSARWTGLAMLAVGAMMVAWALTRPVVPDREIPPG